MHFSSKFVSVCMGILIIPCAIIQRIMNIQDFFYIRWCDSVILGILFLLIGFSLFASKGIKLNINIDLYIAIIVFLFSLSALHSSFANQEYGMLHVGVINVLILADIFFVMIYIAKFGNHFIFTKTVFLSLIFLCFINDVLSLVFPGRFYGNGQFFLYSKFSIAYLHMFVFALSIEVCKKNKFFCLLIWFLSVYMCIYMGCGTGITCFVVMMIVLLLPYDIRAQLCRPVVAICCMLICSVFPFFYSMILNFPFVQYFIVNVLHKSLDLTSRTMIYKSLDRLLGQKPLFGFGQENNYNVCQKYLKLNEYEYAPDVQNGLLDWLISYGIVGAVLLFVLLILCLQRGRFARNNSFIALIYAYFVAGSIEIPFDSLFFFIIAFYAFSANLVCDKVSIKYAQGK